MQLNKISINYKKYIGADKYSRRSKGKREILRIKPEKIFEM
jgi:hypothetical protein